MSLFGGLFGQKAAEKSSLFSSNAFKQQSHTSAAAPSPTSHGQHQQQHSKEDYLSPSAQGGKQKKKRKETTVDEGKPQGSKAAKRQRQAVPTPTARAAAATGAEASDSLENDDGALPTKKQKQRTKGQKQGPAAAAAVAAAAAAASSSDDGGEILPPRKHKQKKNGQKHAPAAAAAAAAAATAQHVEAPQGRSSDSEIEQEGEAGIEGLKGEAAGKERKQKLTPEEHAQQLQRTIFVGNVPAKTALKTLKAFFSKYGEVASARLRAVPVDLKTKMPRRAAIMKNMVDDSRAPAVAYVVFKEEASVQAALAANMAELGGNHLRVDKAALPAKAAASAAATTAQTNHHFDTGRSIFVGNLHFATLDEELIQFFTCPEALEGNAELSPAANGGQPAIEGVRIVRDPATSLNKGFGFVLFRTKAAVRAALSLNGRPLRGRPLRLTRVSVQQQQKLQAQRAATTASASAGRAPRSQQQQQRSSSGGGGGGSNKDKGSLHRTAGGGVRRAGASTAPDPVLWQGTQIKGKAKGVRGTKAMRQQRPAGKQPGGAPGSAKRSGKRPAVAVRKKKQLASKAQQKHKQ